MRLLLQFGFIISFGLSCLTALASGKVDIPPEKALQEAFPDADHREQILLDLTEDLRRELEEQLGRPEKRTQEIFHRYLKGDSVLGYAIVQEGMGKHKPMTFLVLLDPEGNVLRVRMLIYRETKGGQVAQEKWLEQFIGKHSDDPIRVGRDVVKYTGATISSGTIAWGVKRACLLYEILGGEGTHEGS